MKRSTSSPTANAALLGGVLLLALSACSSESERTFIDRSGIDYDLGFLLVIDDSGRRVTNTRPHRFEGDDLLFGERPEIAAEDDERVLLVTMDFDSLAAAAKTFSPDRAHEIVVSFEEPNSQCPNGQLVDDDRRLSLPLPATTRVFEANSAEARLEPLAVGDLPLLASTRLELPVADEGCLDRSLRFQPFFSDPDSITNHVGPIAIYGLVRLDTDRVLTLTGTQIVLLDRTSNVPARVLFDFVPSLAKNMRSSMPRPVVPGTPVPLFVAAQDPSVSPATSIIGLDFEFDGVDRVSLTRTTTLGPGTTTDLAVSPEGGVIITTEDGPLYSRGPNDQTFTAHPVTDVLALYSALAVEGGHFLLGGEVGSLFDFDPATGDRRRIPVEHELAPGLRLRAIAQPNGAEGELWVAGSRGRTLRRRDGRTWESADSLMPRGFRSCGRGRSHPCGGTVQLNAVEELLVLPRSGGREPVILSFVTECSAAIQWTGDERCPGVISFGDLPVSGLGTNRFFVTDVLASRWVTLGREELSSMIYELDLESSESP